MRSHTPQPGGPGLPNYSLPFTHPSSSPLKSLGLGVFLTFVSLESGRRLRPGAKRLELPGVGPQNPQRSCERARASSISLYTEPTPGLQSS